MTKAKEFVEYFHWLVDNCKEEVVIPDNVLSYLKAIEGQDTEKEKSAFTENGKMILRWLQEHPDNMYKAKDIAEGLVVSSKLVSGAIRKLTQDGYVEKVGKAPVIYCITDNGKNVNFEGEN